MRRAVVWAVTVALAAALHTLCARYLAGTDVIVLALRSGSRAGLGVAALLLLARLYLFLLAPGLGLYVLARAAAERWAGPRR